MGREILLERQHPRAGGFACRLSGYHEGDRASVRAIWGFSLVGLCNSSPRRRVLVWLKQFWLRAAMCLSCAVGRFCVKLHVVDVASPTCVPAV